MSLDYLTVALGYAPNAAVDEGRAQGNINRRILDNFKASTKTEVADSYDHWYDTFYVHCLFGGGDKIRVVSRYNLVAQLPGQNRFLSLVRSCTRVKYACYKSQRNCLSAYRYDYEIHRPAEERDHVM